MAYNSERHWSESIETKATKQPNNPHLLPTGDAKSRILSLSALAAIDAAWEDGLGLLLGRGGLLSALCFVAGVLLVCSCCPVHAGALQFQFARAERGEERREDRRAVSAKKQPFDAVDT